MDYTINIYQIDTENIKVKEFIDYIIKDLQFYNPKISIGRYDANININVYNKYKLTNCYKIINKFVKYKILCEETFDDNVCIYLEIR